MTAQNYLKIRQTALLVQISESTYTVYDEAVVLDWGLESLQAVPCIDMVSRVHVKDH